ncbi:MAG: hypothetical protein VKK59_07960 [Vampirovibrionales bacterium]|nr:hypothetical protein [Vampirovibrionales bacterium]
MQISSVGTNSPVSFGQSRSVTFGCPITSSSSRQVPTFGCEPVTGSFMAAHGVHLLMGAAAGALASVLTSAVVFRDKLRAFFSQKQG